MLPFIITFSRLLLAVAFVVAIGVVNAWYGAFPIDTNTLVVLLVLAGVEELTDKLDGMVARRLGQCTELGGLADPLCDSLSRLTMYFAMAMVGWVSLAVPMVMAGRDIVVAYTRIIQARTGGKTSARISGKVKAVFQGGGIFVFVLLAWLPGQWSNDPNNFGRMLRSFFQVGTLAEWLVILATIWSLLDYLYGAWPGMVAMYRERK